MNNYRLHMLRTLNKLIKDEDNLINAALGLCGESGEVADIIKKHKFQNKPLDRKHLIEELGDVRFYMELMAYCNNVTMEEIEEKNVEKLNLRYPEGFPINGNKS